MKAYIETDQEYIDRTSRIDMDYIHSTLQECLGGNIDKYMIEESITLIEEHRDKCIEKIQLRQVSTELLPLY